MSYILKEVELVKVVEKDTDGHWARFAIEPLSPGYGLTVGNALRRVLLSSLEGAAITSIRIEGVSHEFTTVKGVVQDVVDIILQLKQVRIKLSDSQSQVIILDARKKGVVKAGDFKCPTGVEIINKDLEIAEVAEGGKLMLEATVEQGKGYLPTESRKEDKLPIGVIAIDAAFSPVSKVNFQIENTRVGKMTNYDRLILEIGTDGSISPKEAMQKASQILVEHFSVLSQLDDNAAEITMPEVEAEVETTQEETEKPLKKSSRSKKD